MTALPNLALDTNTLDKLLTSSSLGLMATPPIRVVVFAGKGRAVLAARAISRGEVIERVPVLVLSAGDSDHLERTCLDSYVYNWTAGGVAVALGAGSLYNHAYVPNANYLKRFEEAAIDFVALRDIAEGEEIVINYNGDPADQTPVWFDVK